MPARQTVKRKPRRAPRPVARPPAGPGSVENAADAEDATPQGTATARPAIPTRARVQPAPGSARAAMAARSEEMARLDVQYLRHDLRYVAVIASTMLVIIIALSFVLR